MQRAQLRRRTPSQVSGTSTCFPLWTALRDGLSGVGKQWEPTACQAFEYSLRRDRRSIVRHSMREQTHKVQNRICIVGTGGGASDDDDDGGGVSRAPLRGAS